MQASAGGEARPWLPHPVRRQGDMVLVLHLPEEMTSLERLLDFLCRGEKTLLTHPEVDIEIFFCSGWCCSWGVRASNYKVGGWRFGSRDFMEGFESLSKMMRKELRIAEAAELDRLALKMDELMKEE